jgi:enamine deaminase RidA (YjgF/YER057c/UK114 family)
MTVNSDIKQKRNKVFQDIASELGHSFDGEIKVGGNYISVVVHNGLAYVSGQVPRVGSTVMVVGRVGETVSLEQAQVGAKICVMRALALLNQSLDGLEKITRVIKMNVYTQSTSTFTQQSEVADAASEVLQRVLGDAGRHVRTSVGVYQLPKNAAIELDITVAVDEGAKT